MQTKRKWLHNGYENTTDRLHGFKITKRRKKQTNTEKTYIQYKAYKMHLRLTVSCANDADYVVLTTIEADVAKTCRP